MNTLELLRLKNTVNKQPCSRVSLSRVLQLSVLMEQSFTINQRRIKQTDWTRIRFTSQTLVVSTQMELLTPPAVVILEVPTLSLSSKRKHTLVYFLECQVQRESYGLLVEEVVRDKDLRILQVLIWTFQLANTFGTLDQTTNMALGMVLEAT